MRSWRNIAECKCLQIKPIMVERKHKYSPSDVCAVARKVKVCVYRCNYRMTHILCPCFVPGLRHRHQHYHRPSPRATLFPYKHTFIYESRRFFIKMFYRIQVAILGLPKDLRFIRSSPAFRGLYWSISVASSALLIKFIASSLTRFGDVIYIFDSIDRNLYEKKILICWA